MVHCISGVLSSGWDLQTQKMTEVVFFFLTVFSLGPEMQQLFFSLF